MTEITAKGITAAIVRRLQAAVPDRRFKVVAIPGLGQAIAVTGCRRSIDGQYELHVTEVPGAAGSFPLVLLVDSLADPEQGALDHWYFDLRCGAVERQLASILDAALFLLHVDPVDPGQAAPSAPALAATACAAAHP